MSFQHIEWKWVGHLGMTKEMVTKHEANGASISENIKWFHWCVRMMIKWF